MFSVVVRELAVSDRAQWQALWEGYLQFYETRLAAAVADITWARFHDDLEPMWALGAFVGDRMVGIAHIIVHRSCWSEKNYCYLQDLFTADDMRQKGVGRALIEKVYDTAKRRGLSQVHWLTHETNSNAMLLYDRIAEKSGFIQYRAIL